MYKDDYISAFGKLAPSEEWMTDTLAKMRAAEAEQEAPGAAGRPALRVSGKKHPRLRRAALPVAAAVALLAVPAAAAQACVDKAVASPSLKGILAFTPATVVVPERILFYRVDIFVELEKLLFFLKEQEKQH